MELIILMMIRTLIQTEEYTAPKIAVLEVISEQVFAGSMTGNGFDDVYENDYEW